jgi:hypothetical protein
MNNTGVLYLNTTFTCKHFLLFSWIVGWLTEIEPTWAGVSQERIHQWWYTNIIALTTTNSHTAAAVLVVVSYCFHLPVVVAVYNNCTTNCTANCTANSHSAAAAAVFLLLFHTIVWLTIDRASMFLRSMPAEWTPQCDNIVTLPFPQCNLYMQRFYKMCTKHFYRAAVLVVYLILLFGWQEHN